MRDGFQRTLPRGPLTLYCVGIPESELSELERSGASLHVLATRAASTVGTRMAEFGRGVLVVGLDTLTTHEVLATLVSVGYATIPVVFRFGRNAGSAIRMLAIHERAAWSRVSIVGFDDLSGDVAAAAIGDRSRGALPRVLARLAPLLVERCDAAEIVTLAASIAVRRRLVSDLAMACATAVVTLNRRLKHSGLVPAAELLDQLLCLHAAYVLDFVGLTVQQAASCCGFDTRAAFDDFVRRHTALTPAEIARRHAFENLVETLPARIWQVKARLAPQFAP